MERKWWRELLPSLWTTAQSVLHRKPIWICRAGRVWHAEEGCRALSNAIPAEWSPCTFCASRAVTPYINDLQGSQSFGWSQWMVGTSTCWRNTWAPEAFDMFFNNGPCKLNSMQPGQTCHLDVSTFVFPLKMGGRHCLIGYCSASSRKRC